MQALPLCMTLFGSTTLYANTKEFRKKLRRMVFSQAVKHNESSEE